MYTNTYAHNETWCYTGIHTHHDTHASICICIYVYINIHICYGSISCMNVKIYIHTV